MDISGEYRIAAPRQEVWDALNDPAILKQCIDGCETLDRISDTELEGKVLAKVGPVKARFNGTLTLSDLNPPESYTIAGEGTGGPAGFAKGRANVTLADDDGTTILRYALHANVGGKLAQLGARLIAGTAKKTADDFFGRLCMLLVPPIGADGDTAGGGSDEGHQAQAAIGAPAATAALPLAAKARQGLSPVIWIGSVILLVLALVYAYSG